MTLESYLNENEEIKLQIHTGIGKQLGDKIVNKRIGNLTLTTRRVIHYQKIRNNIEYRDVPIDKISYLEHKWHDRKLVLIIFGGVFMVLGAIFLISMFSSIYFILFGLIFLILGIIMLVLGLKQFGYLLINDKEWKFVFKRRDGIRFVEEFIKQIYFLI